MSRNPSSPVAKKEVGSSLRIPPRFPNLRFPLTLGCKVFVPSDGPHPGAWNPYSISLRPKSAFEVGRMSGICRLAETLKFHVETCGPFDHQKCPPKEAGGNTVSSCHLNFFCCWTPKFMNRELLVKVPFMAESQFFWRFVDLTTTSYWGIV